MAKEIVYNTRKAKHIPRAFHLQWIPFAIPIITASVFVSVEVVVFILPLSFLDNTIRYMILPALLTFAITRVKPNYQPLYIYIPKKIHHIIYKNKESLGGTYLDESQSKQDEFVGNVTVVWKGKKLVTPKKKRRKLKHEI